MATMNGRCGAIRLNVRGRDPYGSIEPDAEYDAVCADLTRELGELVDGATGLPAIAETIRTDELYGPDAHPNLPDLIVRWNQELNVIETLRSPRVGTVSRPVQSRAMPRSGDHSTESRLWAVGSEPPAGAEAPGMRGVDLGPTILSLLAVELPPGLDGRPIDLAAPAVL
jgi:predicted AlkP superfamily phosphohydrolase/phosphomutase